MNILKFKILNKPYFLVIILTLLIIPTFVSLLRTGYFPMQDDLQAFRVHQMDKCIQDMQIPCRWVPDAGYQYGYPQFNYYPPSVYYLGEVLHLIGFQFIDSVKILFILGFIFSAWAMFLFLRAVFGNWSALVGAVLYSYAPYKAVDVYVRGALSEFWAFVFFPLIFWAIFRLIKTGSNKYIGFLAVSIGLLLITHNLMSLIFLPLALVWGIFFLYLEKNFRERFLKLFFGGLLGLSLAAFFTLPVLFEKQYAHLESLIGGYFDWRQHFVDISQLFLSNHFGYGSSNLGPGDDLSLSTGQIPLVIALVGVALALIFYSNKRQRSLHKEDSKIAKVVIAFFAVDLFVLFLIHQKSSFIWEKLPILHYLQFPWRILADSVFLLSLLSAASIYLIKDKKLSIFVGALGIFLSLTLYGSFFTPLSWLNISDEEKFSGIYWEKQLTISIFDYLPIYGKLPPNHKAPDFPEVLDGKAEFLSYKKGSNFQLGEFNAGEMSTLRLPLFDFPGMEVKLDGKKTTHINNDCRLEEYCFGLITVSVPEGSHFIETRLEDTPIRRIGNLLSLFGILAVSFIFFKHRKDEKH